MSHFSFPYRYFLAFSLAFILICQGGWAVDFGERAVSLGYWTETISLQNTTAETVSLTGDPRATITGTDAADFEVVVQPSTTIAQAGAAYVKVTFNPSAPGARTATLEVPTDNATLGTMSITLDGTGGSPAVTTLNANLDHDFSGTHAGSVNLQLGTLNLTGNTMIEGDLVITGGTVAFNGFGLTVDRDLRLDSGVTLAPGGSALDIGGNLLQKAGRLDPNGSVVEIGGDFRIQTISEDGAGVLSFGQSSGSIRMNGAGDEVMVHGNFSTDSNQSNAANIFTEGTLEIRGDFSQLSTSTASSAQFNFVSTLNHRVVLNGTGPQVVSFADPLTSRFRTLDLQNSGPAAITLAPYYNADFLISHGTSLAPLTVEGKQWNLQADEIIQGDLHLTGTELDLNGRLLTVQGDLIHSGGKLDVATGTLVVEGDCRIQSDNGDGTYGVSSGRLEMNNPGDAVTVLGSFFTDSNQSNAANIFTEGTLAIRGDFSQRSTSAASSAQFNFVSTLNHRVVLNGTGPQVVSFADPLTSRFRTLDLQNSGPAAITLAPYYNADFLISHGTSLAPLTVEGKQWNLQADEIIQGDLHLAGTELDLNGMVLTIQGDLIHSGGKLDVATGTLVVEGDCRIQSDNGDGTYGVSSGRLEMNNPGDAVTVLGSFFTDSNQSNAANIFTEGALAIRGDFSQRSTSAASSAQFNFVSTLNHRVVLNGTGPQVVSFADPLTSRFRTLDLENSGPAAITLAPYYNADFLISHGTSLAPLTVEGKQWNLQADEIIQGDLHLAGTELDLNGMVLTVQGDLIHSGGKLDVASGTLVVEGDYRIQSDNGDGTYGVSSGRLEMNNPGDAVTVLGSFFTDSNQSNAANIFTEGTLAIRGDFSQLSTSAATSAQFNFTPTLNHRVILIGNSAQTISFADPATSGFRNLELYNNPAVLITFATRARATGSFDHHQRRFVLSPGTLPTDFKDSDADGQRDHVDLFPIGDANNNGVPDSASPATYSYDDWRRIHYWEGGPNFDTISAIDFDFDGDEQNNLEEYLQGTLPTRANPRPTKVTLAANGEEHLALEYPRVKAAAAHFEIEGSGDLISWTPNMNVPEVITDDGEIETVRVRDTESANARRFMTWRAAPDES